MRQLLKKRAKSPKLTDFHLLLLFSNIIFQLTGFSGTQYSHEYTVIDPTNKEFSLTTRNVSFGGNSKKLKKNNIFPFFFWKLL